MSVATPPPLTSSLRVCLTPAEQVLWYAAERFKVLGRDVVGAELYDEALRVQQAIMDELIAEARDYGVTAVRIVLLNDPTGKVEVARLPVPPKA